MSASQVLYYSMVDIIILLSGEILLLITGMTLTASHIVPTVPVLDRLNEFRRQSRLETQTGCAALRHRSFCTAEWMLICFLTASNSCLF
jgi:hypothetical protein